MAEDIRVFNVVNSWNIVSEYLLPDRTKKFADKRDDEILLQDALKVLDDNNILPHVVTWFQQAARDDIRCRVARDFWAFFNASNYPDVENIDFLPAQFCTAVQFLYDVIQTYKTSFKKIRKIEHLAALRAILDQGGSSEAGSRCDRHFVNGTQTRIEDEFVLLLKSFIFAGFPKKFQLGVELFYKEGFQIFRKDNESDFTSNEAPEKLSMEHFSGINKKLHDMGLMEHVSGMAITLSVTDHIRVYILDTCRGDFETSFLDHLEMYLESKVLEWLRLIYCHSADMDDSISSFRGRLRHFIYETYANVLIEDLFNIVIDFPESEPALKDLRHCLEIVNLRNYVVTSLKSSIERRLLHPGVNTSEVLTAYIAAIQALRSLDPSGVLLELICEPVRRYLRSRDDTVRCIVSSLTDHESNDLMEELLKGGSQVFKDRSGSDDESESWETWQPDPVDANPATASKRRREQDIISTLVNIYGSQDMFVAEYRSLLADRLLLPSANTIALASAGGGSELERELRYLELLKLRFGEIPLHMCHVMLKDVADSRRINARIQEIRQMNCGDPENCVNAIILSAQFWPSFREERITLPVELQEVLDSYTQQYETLKGNRTLAWKPHLGAMTIELEMDEQTLTFTVSPVHAALIMQFQDQKCWTVDELGTLLGMAPSAVRRKLSFWQSHGLLKQEQPDVFALLDHPSHLASHEIITAGDDELESALASASQQREEEMQMFWAYVTRMLQNLDSLPIERIHSMLRMFAVPGNETEEISLQQVKGFLDRKVREQKLVFAGGAYRLPKV